MTSAIMRRDLVRYFALLSMLQTIMVIAWLCHDINGCMALEGMIVRYFEYIFTFRLDNVPCGVWESPDSEWILKQAKLRLFSRFAP